MICRIALRNLIHDRVRLAVTLVGILFSVVLVSVQLGLYIGASNMIVALIEHVDADLWLMPYGAKNFEEAQPISDRDRYTALSTAGVHKATALVTSFVDWHKPSGGSATVMLIGSDPQGGLQPWNMVAGDLAGLGTRDAVIVDRSYLAALGINGVGDVAEIGTSRARVVGLTDGIRSFTVTPYVFTTLNRSRSFLGLPSDKMTFALVKLEPGAEIATVQNAIRANVRDSEVLTKAEFRERSLNHWLFATGAGFALIVGAVLGLLVGTVIVAQTLYSSTKDHLNEFATLRALGSTSGYIQRVILAQAGLSALLGYALGMALSLAIIRLSANSALQIVMTPMLAALLLALTFGMCAISALSAIAKVTRIDPAIVFRR